MITQAAKELRYAGYAAKADHCMVQVVVECDELELQRLQAFYSIALACKVV